MPMRLMSKDEALAFIEFAREYHSGKHKLPPEIIETKRELEEAIRKSELFIVLFGVIDQTLLNRAVALMHQKDRLYSQWAARSTSNTSILH